MAKQLLVALMGLLLASAVVAQEDEQPIVLTASQEYVSPGESFYVNVQHVDPWFAGTVQLCISNGYPPWHPDFECIIRDVVLLGLPDGLGGVNATWLVLGYTETNVFHIQETEGNSNSVQVVIS